ncbi:Atlastin-1 family protein-like protein [Leptotrombidium deliense]|uniref:Atlastin-1 family protein-like protein n=1 Tax=Leptotrombidium deliense TaxID=299467 RepID=A0A443S4J9_9ACAR|nr:Atlastin-1 family protein-like protein [Leptotrombidium deliense]
MHLIDNELMFTLDSSEYFNIHSSEPKSVCIYEYRNGCYEMNLPAIYAILDKIGERRLAVYSMNGEQRTGRSFLLNFFVRYLNAQQILNTQNVQQYFAWNGGNKKVTSGIYLWSEPFFIRKPDGNEIGLLLMDTQGCFGDDSGLQESGLMFTFSLLFSSFVMFNVRKNLDDEKLLFVEYFVEFAKAMYKPYNEHRLQQLLFIVRDWSPIFYGFGFHKDDNCDTKNYKKAELNANHSQCSGKRYVRERLMSAFDEIQCFLMPFPGKDVAKRSEYSCTSARLAFNEHLETLVLKVLKSDKIVEKVIDGKYVTGVQMKSHVNNWINMFNGRRRTQPKNNFQLFSAMQHEMCLRAAVDQYCTNMHEFLFKVDGHRDHVVEFNHWTLFGDSKGLYQSIHKRGGNRSELDNLQTLRDQINANYDYYRLLNKGRRIYSRLLKEVNEVLLAFEKQREKSNAVVARNREQRECEQVQIKLNESARLFDEKRSKYNQQIHCFKIVLQETKKELIDLRRNQMGI